MVCTESMECRGMPRNAEEGWQRQPLRERHGTHALLAGRESTALPTPRFGTSSLQNCKRIHFGYLKPPSLQCFIMAAPGSESRRSRKAPPRGDFLSWHTSFSWEGDASKHRNRAEQKPWSWNESETFKEQRPMVQVLWTKREWWKMSLGK